VNLYGFSENNGINTGDILGLGFWGTLVDIVPFVGTIKNLFIPPNGARVGDYKIELDLELCELDRAIAELKCMQSIQSQLAANFAAEAITTLVHDGIDVGLALVSWPTAVVPIALAIDAGVDSVATLYDMGKMFDAARAAQAKCKCPFLLGCNDQLDQDEAPPAIYY